MKTLLMSLGLGLVIAGCGSTSAQLTRNNAPTYSPCGVKAELWCNEEGTGCRYILPRAVTAPCSNYGDMR